MNQEPLPRLPRDKPFNRERWIADACDLANLILESPIATEHDSENGRLLKEADWTEADPLRSQDDRLLSFALTRRPIAGGFSYRLYAHSHATGIVDSYQFYTDNQHRSQATFDIYDVQDHTNEEPLTMRQAAANVIRYLMLAEPVDRKIWIENQVYEGAEQIEREVKIEEIAADPVTERAINFNAPGYIDDEDEETQATIGILAYAYGADSVIVHRGIARLAERIREEHGRDGQA